jgi:hypothetical protein
MQVKSFLENSVLEIRFKVSRIVDNLLLFLHCLFFDLKMEEICSSETSAVAKLHGGITQKTVLFIVTVVKN